MLPIAARSATEDEIAVYHTHEYIAGIRAHAAGGPSKGSWGEVDDETVLSPGSFEAALYAAGGSMNAVDAVMKGEVGNAYALVRPPGHHATKNQAMGFCIFNNTVIAAHHARNVFGLERIMIVDWDVHHGNGTQDAFYEDPAYYSSLCIKRTGILSSPVSWSRWVVGPARATRSISPCLPARAIEAIEPHSSNWLFPSACNTGRN